jgi:Cu/Ag efflux protein CusF
VGPKTHVVFSDGAEYFPDPTYKDLAVGMYVYFRFTTDLLDEIEVREIPAGARRTPAPAPERAPSSADRRVIKVRVLSLDDRRGELRADVAGRQESFRVAEPRTLRRYAEGDLVILTVEARDGEEVVTEIRAASQSGRVTRVDKGRGEIAIDSDGREERYRVDDKRLLEGVRVGDRVRFEFEDRPHGVKVITGIH